MRTLHSSVTLWPGKQKKREKHDFRKCFLKPHAYGLKDPLGSAYSAHGRTDSEGSEFQIWYHATLFSADVPMMTSENLEFTSDRLFLLTSQKLHEITSSNGRNES